MPKLFKARDFCSHAPDLSDQHRLLPTFRYPNDNDERDLFMRIVRSRAPCATATAQRPLTPSAPRGLQPDHQWPYHVSLLLIWLLSSKWRSTTEDGFNPTTTRIVELAQTGHRGPFLGSSRARSICGHVSGAEGPEYPISSRDVVGASQAKAPQSDLHRMMRLELVPSAAGFLYLGTRSCCWRHGHRYSK